MKGGPSVRVLIDLAFGDDAGIASQAAEVLKTQVFLYEADTDRIDRKEFIRKYRRKTITEQLAAEVLSHARTEGDKHAQ